MNADYILSNSLPVSVRLPKCGIYFLIQSGEIVYIGQSTQIPNRLKTHKRSIKFDKVFCLECSRDDLDAIERQYIRQFNPRINGMFAIKPKNIIQQLAYEKLGVTSYEGFAEKVGLKYSTARLIWLHVSKNHKADHLKAVADALGTTIDELFYGQRKSYP